MAEPFRWEEKTLKRGEVRSKNKEIQQWPNAPIWRTKPIPHHEVMNEINHKVKTVLYKQRMKLQNISLSHLLPETSAATGVKPHF